MIAAHAGTVRGIGSKDVKYRALGPLTAVVEGEERRLGGPRQRMVLAVLLSHVNHTVSQDALIEETWAGEPPSAAKSTLQGYIYGLRTQLGPDAIIRHTDGYRVEADEGTFDVLLFDSMVLQARQIEDNPAEASATLGEALDLWYGTPYGGLDTNPALAVEISRLNELRLVAVERRIDADLAAGLHAHVVGELDTMVREHPLRERFCAQHMLALYRCGRQAEALRAYEKTRTYLAEELGIDPSPELRVLEQRILEQDPSLGLVPVTGAASSLSPVDHSPSSSPPGKGRMVRGYELREPLGEGDFGVVYRAFQPSVGREVAIKMIRAEFANRGDFIARFEHEAQLVAHLEHPHIVPIFDYWRDPEGAHLVMPYLRGGSLAKALSRGGWNLSPALRLIEQIGGALGHAHRHGVIHRDVKPSNVLLDEDGNAYLSDFGIALRHTDDTDHPVTTSQVFVPPEELSGERHTARSDVFSLGVLIFSLFSGVVPKTGLPLPVLSEIRPGLPRELDAVIIRAADPDPDNRFDRIEDLVRAFRRAAGADVVAVAELEHMTPEREPLRNPYKGLRAFRETDALDFYGRDALVEELLQAVAGHNLVAVVGPSGSGKSSVVHAGLVPALRAGGVPGSRQWLIADMFPGSFPFEELEAALLRVAVDRPSDLLDDLSQENGLLRVTKQILPGDDATLLLVIDQFEEIFSSVASEATRRLFLDNLVSIATDERSRVRVVLTMRADFFSRALEYGDLAETFRHRMVTVGPPTRDGLAQAISAPARALGVELEPGLVGRVISDVEGQPGGLPLMQYALTEMFASRQGEALTSEDYENTGGVLGALGRRAEEVYEGLPESGKEAVRQLFMRLVSVDETTADTRRRATRPELRSLDVDQDALDQAITQFGGYRLLSFDRHPITRSPTVEVAHEALLREWDRLAGWIDDRRDELILSRRIGAAAHEWEEQGKDPSFLLRGARLEQAEAWLEGTDIASTTDEVRYLEASREQRLAEEAASRLRRRWTLATLTAGLVVVAIAAAVAVAQRGVAQGEARQEEVRRLAASSELALEEDPERAILLALEAAEVSRRAGEPIQPEAVVALHQAVQSSRLETRFDQYLAVGFDSDGEVALEELLYPRETPDDWPGAVISPDRRLAAERVLDAQHETGQIVVWEVATRQEVARLVPRTASGEGMYVTSGLQWSPDSRILTAPVSDRSTTTGRLKLWETNSWKEAASIPISFAAPEFAPDSIASVGAFPDSDILAVLDPEGEIVLVDPGTGEEIGRLENPNPDAARILIDYKRNRLLIGTWEQPRRVEQWDLQTGALQWSTRVADGSGIAFSEATGTVASFGADGKIRLHDPVTGLVAETLHGHLNSVADVGFSPDGSLLVSRSLTETLVWDVSSSGPRAVGTIGIDAGTRPLPRSLSPTGTEVAVMYEGGLSRFRLSDGAMLGDTQGMVSVQFPSPVSPDWTRVGVVDDEGRGWVQDLVAGNRVLELPPCAYPLAFSSDGGMLVVNGRGLCSSEGAAADADLRSRVISVPAGEELVDLGERFINPALGAAFNPAGTFEADRYLAVLFTPEVELLEIYDTVARTLVARLQFSHLPLSVAFDPTGRYVGVGTADGSVRVLDLTQVIDGMPAEEALVFDRVVDSGAVIVRLDTDGLMAASSFGSLRLWDFHTGERLLDIPVSTEDFPVPIFANDGESLFYRDLSSQGEEVLRRLPLVPDELVALAQSRVTRDLTPAECEQYHVDC